MLLHTHFDTYEIVAPIGAGGSGEAELKHDPGLGLDGTRITENLHLEPSSAGRAAMSTFEKDMAATQEWFDCERFKGITCLYSTRQVVEQFGTTRSDYTLVRDGAIAFCDRLRQLFGEGESVTTLAPAHTGRRPLLPSILRVFVASRRYAHGYQKLYQDCPRELWG